MSRINTNVASMNAIHKLIANNGKLNTSLQRLSSGLRINTGKDDPAGLIASETLRSEIRGIEKGIKNSERASSVIATAEGALNEISSLLLDIKGLLVESANKGALASSEIDANQLQVDSAINSIERISNSTQFNGVKLLNGNLSYSTMSANALELQQVRIQSAKLIDGADMIVDVQVTASAQTGSVFMSGVGLSSAGSLSIQLGSNRGSTELTFAASASISVMASAVNAVKEITGVSAFISGTTASLNSVDFGTDSFVSIEVLGADDWENMNGGLPLGMQIMLSSQNPDIGDQGSLKDYGIDVTATVNGALTTGNGRELTVRTAMLEAIIDLSIAQSMSTTSSSFTITGGGADFAIGAQVDAIGLAPIAIQSVAPSQLGNVTDGFLNSLKSGKAQEMKGTNLMTAQRVIDSAIENITVMRGRLGSFQRNVLETNINSLRISMENVTSAESSIRDTDFATETAAMTRAQILIQANTHILALANSAPQNVLALLG